MNNFPAMTEAQRQELIQHATEEIRLKTGHIARLEKHMPGQFNTSRYQMDVLTAKIALAALTANPRGYIDAGTPSDEINILTENKILKTDIALYTAPPASVLRVPEGWKLVPADPTDAMIVAVSKGLAERIKPSRYRAMLAASPEANYEQ